MTEESGGYPPQHPCLENPMTEESGGYPPQHPCLENPMDRGVWRLPTPASLPGESHGQRSLVGYRPQGREGRTQLSDFTLSSELSDQ